METLWRPDFRDRKTATVTVAQIENKHHTSIKTARTDGGSTRVNNTHKIAGGLAIFGDRNNLIMTVLAIRLN